MKRPSSVAFLWAVLSTLLAPACDRSDDDLPPPIPVPGAPAPRPQPLQADPEPPPAPFVPKPAATATTDAGEPLDAGPPPSASVTPFQIPWPLPIPSSFSQLPSLPQIPGLPAIPGFGGSSAPESPAPSAQPQGETRVVVYGTKWCGACQKLKGDLRARSIPYEFVDVEDPRQLNSPAGRGAADIPSSMRGGVPVTRITQRNGQTVWVQGCDPNRIEKAYRA